MGIIINPDSNAFAMIVKLGKLTGTLGDIWKLDTVTENYNTSKIVSNQSCGFFVIGTMSKIGPCQ